MLDVIIDAVVDTLKSAPVIVMVYYLMELIEYKHLIRLENNALLKGKLSPIVGASMGIIPQCGISVASTELFAKGKISVGALVAVYIATSDEALPLLLAGGNITTMLMLIVSKLVLGIVAGYLANILFLTINRTHRHEHSEGNHAVEVKQPECCHHEHKHEFNYLHPLVHSLKILAFILAVNLVMGTLIHYIGETNIVEFLRGGYAYQPLVALVVGLIPNCASSIALVEVYTMGGLSYGALLTGLCANAGLGMVMLLKGHKSVKENVFVISFIMIFALVVGYAVHLIG